MIAYGAFGGWATIDMLAPRFNLGETNLDCYSKFLGGFFTGSLLRLIRRRGRRWWRRWRRRGSSAFNSYWRRRSLSENDWRWRSSSNDWGWRSSSDNLDGGASAIGADAIAWNSNVDELGDGDDRHSGIQNDAGNIRLVACLVIRKDQKARHFTLTSFLKIFIEAFFTAEVISFNG